jgi:hypothetical protein
MEGMTLVMDVTVYIPSGTPHLSYWGKNLDEITFELVREEEDICAPYTHYYEEEEEIVLAGKFCNSWNVIRLHKEHSKECKLYID